MAVVLSKHGGLFDLGDVLTHLLLLALLYVMTRRPCSQRPVSKPSIGESIASFADPTPVLAPPVPASFALGPVSIDAPAPAAAPARLLGSSPPPPPPPPPPAPPMATPIN